MTGSRRGRYITSNLLVKQSPRLDRVFSALSDPTRRAIVARLARGTASVSDVAAPFQMSLPAVSKHIRVLEEAGIVRRNIQGRVHQLRLVGGTLRDADHWLARYRTFWEGQLDALKRHIESEAGGDTGDEEKADDEEG